MNKRTENQINAMLRAINRRRWHVVLLVCLALVVTAGVVGVFHLPAIAKTYQVTQLTCASVPPEGPAYADFFVHIHNDDCFDANGNLVCPLPEIRPHRHTADCYTTTRTLICTVPESDGHQHTADCYTRVRSDLICELSTEPVLGEAGNVLSEGHVHTDECFSWKEELSCGMETGQGAHHHDDSCYETTTTLTCDLPEILLHTHTDECYQKNEDGSLYVDEDGNTWLICGQLQVTEHIHGPECFTTYELDDGEPEVVFMEEEKMPEENGAREDVAGDADIADDGNTVPADDSMSGGKKDTEAGEDEKADGRAPETDTQTVKDTDNGGIINDAGGGETGETDDTDTADTDDASENTQLSTEKETVEETVSVSMPAQEFQGATDEVEVFVSAPEGAFPEGTTMHVTTVPQEEVIGALNEAAGGAMVRNVQAVDITFRNAEGEEIEPLLPISVRMSRVAKEQPSVMEATPETKESVVLHVENDGNAQIVENANVTDIEAVFESDSFSTYIMADLITEDYLASDGTSYRISVKYDANAKIPEGAELAVSEITGGVSAYGQGYEDYLADTENALGENERVTFARFFDISIIKDGIEIQPEAPVEVKIELVDNLTKNVKAVHFDESVDVLETSLNHDGTVVFSADSFSVYGIILTEVIRTDFLTSYGALYDVAVHYNSDAEIPEGSTLRVTEIEQGTEAYENSYRLLFNSEPDEDAPMLAVDISILSPDGVEIEPRSTVTVDLTLKQLPEGVSPEELQGTIKIDHLKEVPGGIAIETVASASDIMVDETIEASFEVDRFSQFNITWNYSGIRATVQVHYVDEDGNDLNGQRKTNISYTSTNTTYTFAEYATQKIDDASYIEARLGSFSGNKVTSVSFSRSGNIGNRRYTTTFYNGSTQVSTSTDNQTYDVYLVYENTAPGLTVSKTSTGATTPADATFTVSSTDGEYTRTFTYADMTNGKMKFEDAPLGKTYTVTESGGERNGYILTTTYGNNVSLTESRPSGTLTANNAYANDPNVVKVYVYVAAYDQEGNQFKNNPEFLELLGISGDTVDGNGYFPVGEIYIDKSFFNGKTTNKWTALINSTSDWEHVLAALGELDTSTLVYDSYNTPTDYSLNRGNSVGDYMDQAIGDINKGAGSQCTALFGWSGHSYGFEDQTVEYHLDLRFQTNKVTFITGNNGIRTGASRDGTTVDVRAYIQGSAIQQPRNLVIPAGYRLVGYYNDPDFTTPWNKIGTPIIHDEVAYIKITPQDNVILYYKPVPAGGGTVSLDAEGVNPETGTPRGSTATANPGYSFVGWYADEECTQLLSTNATYVPTKGSSERWVDGTTYYAKFVENTVTLTFKAEDHIDHLEMNSVPENVVSYEFSEDRKTLTVVLDAASGSPVTVTGVPENGYAVKEWTIDGRNGALTTADEITTAKTDDPAATNNLWTDRTYHVWAEVLKTITVTKEVNIIGTLEAEEVDATVYFALKDMSKDPAPWVYNKDGSIYTTSIQLVDGVPQGTTQFVDLPAGTYEVWEVADANAGSFGPGSEIAPRIVVSRIQTWISDTDTGNDVILSDDDPDGEIKVINTLNHANEAMTFWANKKWFTVKNSYTDANAEANVDVPAGAWVDFTLYRINADGSEDEVQTIRLDGTPNDIGEEEAWAAAFRDLPNVDHEGNPVTYYVKETAMADLSAYDYYTTFNDTTYTNGGSISNVVAYGKVNVTKEIELPADISEEDQQAFLDALQITVVGPAEVNESRRLSKTLGRDDFTVAESTRTVTYGSTAQSVKVLTLTAITDDLPAGTYTVSESGYNAEALAYQWDPAHSWIKSDKLPPSQSTLVNTEQYGKVSIDVPVGVNVTDGNFTTAVNLLNSYVVLDIKATKVWDDLGLENADHPSVSITLFRTDGSGTKTAVSTQIIGANQTGDNLTLTWANQPQTYTYSVEEAPVSGYYLESVTGNAREGFVVTNQRAAVIKVVKTDQAGTALADAVFSDVSGGLIKNGPVTTAITGEAGSQEAVILTDNAVPIGTYTIREDAAPAGYNQLSGDVTIEVKLNETTGQILVDAKVGGAESAFAHAAIIDVNHPELGWKVTIKNNAGVELPSTGGAGTAIFTAIGGIMTAVAGAVMTLKKRKEHA